MSDDVEFEVVARDGHVHVMTFDESDDMEVLTLSPEDAKVLAEAIYKKAMEAEEST